MVIGITLVILGITAFAYQAFAMQTAIEGQGIWALPPIVATAMLLVAGIVLVAGEAKAFWMKQQPVRRT
jgi:hypothetical protein